MVGVIIDPVAEGLLTYTFLLLGTYTFWILGTKTFCIFGTLTVRGCGLDIRRGWGTTLIFWGITLWLTADAGVYNVSIRGICSTGGIAMEEVLLIGIGIVWE